MVEFVVIDCSPGSEGGVLRLIMLLRLALYQRTIHVILPEELVGDDE